jgi:uncharacterized membrane protein
VLAEYLGFFSRDSLGQFGFRWLHILAGITWIGLLYYFNLVQVPAFAKFEAAPNQEIGGKARMVAIDKVARSALWWFRWAAVSTFVTGILITIITKEYFYDGFGTSARGLSISLGMLLGTIMLINVWGVIWRNQKIVLANAANVLNGGAPNPAAAGAGRAGTMASRQNTIFSVSMLFFMVYTSHGPYTSTAELSGGKVAAFWIISLLLIAVLELNCLGLMPWKREANTGLNVLYDGPGVRNPLIAAFGLWIVFLIVTEIFFKL